MRDRPARGGPRGDEIAIAAIEGLPARLTARGRGLVFAGRTATPVHLPESRVLEITGGHREPSGAEQTLTVVERSDRIERLRASVHAHQWGSVGPEQIAAMMAAQPPCTAPG